MKIASLLRSGALASVLLPGLVASAQSLLPGTAVQSVGPMHAPQVVTIAGRDGQTVWLDGTGFVIAHTVLTNKTQASVTVLGVGMGPGLFTPVAPIVLGPGESKPFEMGVNMSSITLPMNGPLFLEVDRGPGGPKVVVASLSLSSKEVVLLDKQALRWDIGEAPISKTIAITNVPAGTTIVGAKVMGSNAAFNVTIDGMTVTVTPKSTDTALGAPVVIETSPKAIRPTSFLAYVMRPAPSPLLSIGALPIKPTSAQ